LWQVFWPSRPKQLSRDGKVAQLVIALSAGEGKGLVLFPFFVG
jgi:hypothetical protein